MFTSDLMPFTEFETNLAQEQAPVLPGQSFDWEMLRLERLPNLERHWHSQSEYYAPADALLTALDRGWQIFGDIYSEECFLSKRRRVLVFHFALWRDGECMYMPVISNPFLHRFLKEQLSSFTILPD